MNRKKQNRKSFRFLFLMVLSFFAFNLLSEKIDFSKGTSYEVSTVKAQECTTCGESVLQERIVDEGTEFIIYDATTGEFLEGDNLKEFILGTGTSSYFSGSCDDPLNVVDLERKTCVDSGTVIQHGERFRGVGLAPEVAISQKINILRLSKVYYPLAFFLGEYEPYSSNKEIAIDKPEYFSSGESLPGNKEYLLKTLTPQQAERINQESERTEREPYEVTALLATDDAYRVIEVRDGCYLVENPNNLKGDCSRDVSTYDFNVGATNYLGANEEGGGFWRYQIPQRDNYNIPLFGGCIKYPGDEISDGLWPACVTEERASYFEGEFRATWSPDKWEECTIECRIEIELICDKDGKNCVEVPRRICTECPQPIGITVYLSPIFGLVDRCVPPPECNCSKCFPSVDDAPCANSFLTYAYMGTLSPHEAKERTEVDFTSWEKSLMFLVLTKCEGLLLYENGDLERELPNLKCLWDATPTLMNYKLQRKDKIPNQIDFPQDFQDHWREVFQEISNSAAKYGL